jgi:hypothetical protein
MINTSGNPRQCDIGMSIKVHHVVLAACGNDGNRVAGLARECAAFWY